MSKVRSLYNTSLLVAILTSLVSLVGCGGGDGTAEYDPSEVPAMTAEEQQSMEDYDAQMAREQKELYGG